MDISDKRIQELKVIIEKKEGKEISWEEASDSARRLAGLVGLCFDQHKEECRRQEKLKELPRGFKLDGVGYTCLICGRGTPRGGNWYDKYGIKCTNCQSSINKKIIPATLAKDKNKFYTKYDLDSKFNLKSTTLRSWVKKEIIKPRTIPNRSGGTYIQIFLIKDNKGFLPPKKMVDSKLVKEVRKGKDWYHSEPWYKFVNPFEYLKEYKIMEYMKHSRK